MIEGFGDAAVGVGSDGAAGSAQDFGNASEIVAS